MSRGFRFILAASLLAVAGIAGAQQQYINILTGGTSGVYYPLGVAMSQLFGKAVPGAKASVQATKASAENLNTLGRASRSVTSCVADAANRNVTSG